MSPYVLVILVLTMGMGTLVTLISSHWLLAWVGLEMSTLAVLPIMSRGYHPRAIEATTKYFLVQATAASLLLFSGMVNAWLTGLWEIQQLFYSVPGVVFIVGLALKIGLAPFHFWMPDVLQGLSLGVGLVLCTWQKVGPVSILFQLDFFPSFVVVLGLVSSFVGGWGGLNQTQLRKLLAYSSIAHFGWMVVVLQFSTFLGLLNFLFYSVMSVAIFLVLMLNNAVSVSGLAMMWAKLPLISLTIPLVFLSLGGLPPFTGFLPKWLILQELVKQGNVFLSVFMALSALLSLFFYVRVSYVAALTMAPNSPIGATSWRLIYFKVPALVAGGVVFSVMLLPISPLIVFVLS
uniref:NADH-ubiquinone oxidoreductase chain 2 n=1 Tax=Tetrabrachium ocellatum TaxID=242972 RepID=D3KRD4_TETOC|nr:NADH dehydrogenase subunit 2 [Tetrabrachium ocellatum]